MLFFNANFICYYFYPTKKREEPKNVNRFDWRFYFIYTIMFRYISADTVNNGPR